MPITLNHTIVSAQDKQLSADFYCRIFGFEDLGPFASFIVVRVNNSLTLDFAEPVKTQKSRIVSQHYAFKVSEAEFDQIMGRIKQENLVYGSGPDQLDNQRINQLYGGRGAYFRDPDGHILEIMTTDYEIG
ncbi:VOC family protein [Amphritea sp. HPY]|uniref:VOC family protein n=1 Tax=Amphritea sp. HPY TaxID=3421652 RepID=UPI003D7DE61B